MDDLLGYRDRFPILQDCIYLINHSLAAMPAAAEDNLLEYARTWRERGIRAWGEGWWELPLTVGDQIGRILGAPSGSTVMHQNVEIADAIDERTLLVPISHVLFKSGEIQDVERIVGRAHEAGAHVILDAYQSAGILPLDVT